MCQLVLQIVRFKNNFLHSKCSRFPRNSVISQGRLFFQIYVVALFISDFADGLITFRLPPSFGSEERELEAKFRLKLELFNHKQSIEFTETLDNAVSLLFHDQALRLRLFD